MCRLFDAENKEKGHMFELISILRTWIFDAFLLESFSHGCLAVLKFWKL